MLKSASSGLQCITRYFQQHQCLHSFSSYWLPNLQIPAKFQFELIAVHGYPKSFILVSIESTCNFLVINSNVGRYLTATIFEILTLEARKWLVFPPLSC